MKTQIISIMLGIALFSAGGTALAQSATPLSITSGFNADVIANGSGQATNSVTSTIDGSNLGDVFYDSTYASSHGIPSSGALNAGTLTTGVGSFVIASVSGNNALDFLSSGSGTLSFSPTTASQIYVLGTAGNGPTTLNYTLNFAGGTTASGNLTFPDWYNSTQTATVNGLSRVDINNGTYDSSESNDFSLNAESISIALPDQSLNLDSINFSYGSGGEASIFSISSVTPIPEPSARALIGLGCLVLLLLGLGSRTRNVTQ